MSPADRGGRPSAIKEVSAQLADWWSPQQIAGRLRIAYPRDPMMRVSHETIYRACMSRDAVSCAGSWPAACAAGGPAVGLAGLLMARARSPAWS